MPCPPDYSGRGEDRSESRLDTIFWSYKNDSAENAFLGEILLDVGAGEGFVEHPSSQRVLNYEGALCEGSFPQPGGPPGYDDSSESCRKQNWWLDAPRVKSGFSADDVYNPKTIIEETLDDLDLDDVFTEIELELLADDYEGDAVDLIDALIIPIGIMYDGLEHMVRVIETGQDIEEAERTALIIDIISAVLLLVGGFGGVAAGAASSGLRFLGRSLVGLAETGNAAVGFYTAAQTPESTPLVIFNLIMSVANIRDARKVSEAARLKVQLGARGIEGMSATASRLIRQAGPANKHRSPMNIC